jgi:hypothetical protein
MTRPTVWMFLGHLDDPLVPIVLPSVAWMAAEAGALIECYLESRRSGELFAPTGSMVVSGHHHQAWNYVHARCDLRYIVLGTHGVFASSLPLMGEVIASGSTPGAIYDVLMRQPGVGAPAGAALLPIAPLELAGKPFPVATYLYPDLCFGRRLGFADAQEAPVTADRVAYFTPAPQGWQQADTLQGGDDAATITTRIAARWAGVAQGVAFGDPAAIRAQLAWHCRAHRVALFGGRRGMKPEEVRVSAYTEDVSSANDATADFALRLGVPAILGRQTGDGDIIAWSRKGVAMEIVDPGRPPLPVVEALPHPWRVPEPAAGPDDAQLRAWADEGRELGCVLVHSGEIAHNEAMPNLCELAERCGVALGLAACVGRYRTAPQHWELIAAARECGGYAGLVEPLLYGNGWGVMAEGVCPPERLREALASAREAIRAIAGAAHVPRGHYSFLDGDLDTLAPPPAEMHTAMADAGLAFDISMARPGRCRVLRRTPGFLAINQTCRTVCTGSPYVRIQDPTGLETQIGSRPGWFLATLDAPVVAFTPAIWEHGHRILELFRQIGRRYTAATPSTIARYARILAERGTVPSC